jgi:ABC-type transport system involved in multi-copper enzyme maturation permease subunit
MPAPVGPLFFWDVVRLARRGRGHALRFLYAGALLAALAFIHDREFGADQWVSLTQQARFANAFATSLLLVQNVAVLVLVPAYLAGAVAEEKEKKTLDLLLTTALTDREIVLGKMLGRLAHVVGVLLVGLPVLSLAQLWGGVDVTVVLANFAVTGLTLLSVGGASLFCSCLANTALSALLLSFGASALLGVGGFCPAEKFAFSPLAFPFVLDDRIGRPEPSTGGALAPLPGTAHVAVEMVTCYAIVHGGIGLVAVLFAVALLRPAGPWMRGAVPAPPLAEKLPRPPPVLLAIPESIYAPSPPVGDDPLLWKEVLLRTGRAAPSLRNELAMPALMVALVVVVTWIGEGLTTYGDGHGREPAKVFDETAFVLNIVLRSATILLLTVACLVVGFRAAGSVVRERARSTLDGLLTLPLSWEAILRAKGFGSVLRVRHLLYLVAAGWLFSVCTGALHPIALPLIVLTVAAHLAFVACLGLWVSTGARTIPRAHFFMAFLLLLYFGAGGLIWLVTGSTAESPVRDEPVDLALIGLTPWRAWWALMFPLFAADHPAELPTPEAGLLLVAAAVYLLGAAALWQMAVLRFNETRGRTVARPPGAP